MPDIPNTPTMLERVSGNLVTESVLTAVGALAGGALAPILPILTKSLASERQRKRVEATLSEITTVLERHELALRNLTDAQYKLINETTLAVLHTTNEKKLTYLSCAIGNGLTMTDIQPEEADFLSRVIRDISAEEAVFLFQHSSYERVQFGSTSGPERNGIFVIPKEGRNEIIVSGLISLGLLIPAGPTLDDMGVLRFSDCVTNLLMLLRQPEPNRI